MVKSFQSQLSTMFSLTDSSDSWASINNRDSNLHHLLELLPQFSANMRAAIALVRLVCLAWISKAAPTAGKRPQCWAGGSNLGVLVNKATSLTTAAQQDEKP